MNQNFDALLALEIGESCPVSEFESETSLVQLMKDVTPERGAFIVDENAEKPPFNGYPREYEKVWFRREGGKERGRWVRIDSKELEPFIEDA